MHMNATANALPPGPPARNGDAKSDGETGHESANFEVFLGLALNISLAEEALPAGPEGKGGAVTSDAQAGDDAAGTPATAPGNSLPAVLPPALPVVIVPLLPEATDGQPPAISSPVRSASAPAVPPPAAMSDRAAPLPRLPGEASPNMPAGPVRSPGDATDGAPEIPAASARRIPASPTLPAGSEQSPQSRFAQPPLPVVQMLQSASRPRSAQSAAAVISAGSEGIAPAAGSGSHVVAASSVRTAESAAQSQPQGETLADASARQQAPIRHERASGPDMTAPAIGAGETAPLIAEAQPIARTPVGDAPAQPRQGASGTGPHDFPELVDRLARARESASGDLVQTVVTTREFGAVAMRMRADEGRLHVAMTAADPGFAPAVQAAGTTTATGQQQHGNNDSAPSQQQQQQFQNQSDSQARPQQQHADRPAPGARNQSPARAGADEQAATDLPHGEADGAIYA